MANDADTLPLLKGTLDLLILKTLSWGPMHGYGIATWLEDRSAGTLGVDDSALYQALQRMEGRGWLARAEAEWRRVQGDNDPQTWRTVAETFGSGFPYETARTRWRLAEALAEAGDRDQAEQEWRLAVEAADQLGAVPLRAALADLGRRARFGRQPGAYQGPGTLAGLTSREREVLRLLVAGRSNKEIAGALFISPKTASVHVSNILGKLGASSRTEAAAIAHREMSRD